MTHRDSYGRTPGRPAPDCRGTLRPLGGVFVPELRRKVALSQCEWCHALVAHVAGSVAWDEPPPPAAIPVPKESEVTA